jgi:hypothetical protein
MRLMDRRGTARWSAAAGTVLLCCGLAMLAVLRSGHAPGPVRLYQHEEKTAYGAAGGYNSKTGRYPVSKSALAAYLRHQPQSRLARLASGRAQEARDVRLERDSQPERYVGEQRWEPAAEGDEKRKSPGGSAAVREAMSEYMDHQTERARRREAIGARPFPRHPPHGTRPRRSLF